ESWTNQILWYSATTPSYVGAYWYSIGTDYKYEWDFSTSNAVTIEVWAFNSSEFSDFSSGFSAWGYKLSSGKTSDSGTWYPLYTETWYLLFWNNDDSAPFTYLTASITLIWLGEIAISTPSSSDEWTMGETHDIEWTSSHSSPTDPNPYVKIELVERQGTLPPTWGPTLITITASTSNDGSYSWTLPNSVPPLSLLSPGYGIKISSTNEPSKVYDYSAVFLILGGPPAPALTSPANASVIANSTPHLDWEPAVGVLSTAVEYQVQVDNSSLFGSPDVNETTTDTDYSATSLLDGSYYWRVRGKNSTDYWGAWSESWSFIVRTLSITITSPTSSSVWEIGSTYDITWTSVGNISWVDIALYNGTSNLLGPIAIEEPNDGSYSWTIPWGVLTVGSNYWIALQYDSDGDEIYDVYTYTDDFELKAPDGTLSITSPTSSSIWVHGTSVTITWTSTGSIPIVDIFLIKGIDVLGWLAIDTQNTGSYVWTVNSTLTSGSDYAIGISSDYNGDFNPDFYATSDDFTITAPTTSMEPSDSISEDATSEDATSEDGSEADLLSDALGFEAPLLMVTMTLGFLLLVHQKRKRSS
ncbi:MAG: GPI anchored serine-threonine rich family protein, partial [Candidatus Thorarchaeota archaeon]